MNIEASAAPLPLSATPNTQIATAAAPSDDSNNSNTDDEISAEFSKQEIKQLQQLKQRDREVRIHEAAHVAAGSGLVRGGAHFSFERGPDGAQYAVAGSVKIDTSGVAGNPEATLQKATQIQAAALAPAHPSSQDRAIAAKAAQMAVKARAEIVQQRIEETAEQKTETEEKQENSVAPTTSESSGNVIDVTI